MTRTIRTAAELDALPLGSVILDNMGDAGLIDEDRHGRFVQYVETSRVSLRQAAKHYLPARVLHDPSGVPETAVEAARLHSTTEPPPHENHEVCCGECGEAIAYHGCTAEETREEVARAIRSVTDRWDEPLDEVHDVPPVADAILARFTIAPKEDR